MHAGRFVPYCLILAGCISDRYVGSIGRTGSYSNRGFGLTVDLAAAGLDERWTAVDPRKVEDAPLGLQPAVIDGQIDLNGDGELNYDENARYLEPTLRLISRSSSVGVCRIDVSVTILTPDVRDAKLDDLMATALRRLTGQQITLDRWERRRLGPDFPSRVSELREHRKRVALIDQGEFVAEDGYTRRQIVEVVLHADPITPDLRADHNLVLHAISLNRMAAPLTSQERF